MLDKTFKGNDSIEPADVMNKGVQYLYNDGTMFHCWTVKYEQFEVSTDIMEGKRL